MVDSTEARLIATQSAELDTEREGMFLAEVAAIRSTIDSEIVKAASDQKLGLTYDYMAQLTDDSSEEHASKVVEHLANSLRQHNFNVTPRPPLKDNGYISTPIYISWAFGTRR